MRTMKPDRIIIHHSATEDTGTLSWPQIRHYHVNVRKWIDIGYHAGVELVREADGLESYEAMLGRSWVVPGAHCPGQNTHSLGLCLVGNFNEKEPPAGQLFAAARLVALWMFLFRIPVTMIYPHNAFHETDCPGRMFPFGRFVDMAAELYYQIGGAEVT